MKDDFIAASEIADFLYCQRAWWFRLRGTVSANRAVMAQGTEQHEVFAEVVTQWSRAVRLTCSYGNVSQWIDITYLNNGITMVVNGRLGKKAGSSTAINHF